MRSITAIQADIDSTEAAIQAGNVDQSQIDVWNMQIADFKIELQAGEAQQQEKVQAQTEMVESITLPFDYNEVLGNPLANETIIENIKQYRLQDSEEHYAEVARINAEWNVAIKAIGASAQEMTQSLEAKIVEMQRRLTTENEQAQKDAIEITDLTQQVAQLGLEKQDAEQKRDAAVRELGEENGLKELNLTLLKENADLLAQIEALKQELTAKKALTVNGNDKLAELAAKAKESTAQAAQRGINRWNEKYGAQIEPLDIPTLPEATIERLNDVTEQEEPKQEETFHEEVQLVNQPLPVHREGAEESEVNFEMHQADLFPNTITLESLKSELDALKSAHGSRLEKIERQANIQAVA